MPPGSTAPRTVFTSMAICSQFRRPPEASARSQARICASAAARVDIPRCPLDRLRVSSRAHRCPAGQGLGRSPQRRSAYLGHGKDKLPSQRAPRRARPAGPPTTAPPDHRRPVQPALRLAVVSDLLQAAEQPALAAEVELSKVRAAASGKDRGVEPSGQRRRPGPVPISPRQAGTSQGMPHVMMATPRQPPYPAVSARPAGRPGARRMSRCGISRSGFVKTFHRRRPEPGRRQLVSPGGTRSIPAPAPHDAAFSSPAAQTDTRARWTERTHSSRTTQLLIRPRPRSTCSGPGPAKPTTRTCPAPPAHRRPRRHTAAPGPRPPPPGCDVLRPSARPTQPPSSSRASRTWSSTSHPDHRPPGRRSTPAPGSAARAKCPRLTSCSSLL